MTRVRALLAFLSLTAGLGGLPWALARFGRWPISGWPSTEQLRNLGDAVVSDTVVFGVLTLAAWAVWVLFVASFLIEAKAAARGVQAPSLAFAGPVQRAARLLVATVIVGVTIQQPTPRASAIPASPPPTTATSAVDLPAHPFPSTVPMPAPPAVAPRAPDRSPVVVTVAPGDSAWSLAEAHLGDGMRWRDLWEANRHVVQPDGRTWSDPQIIRPGWELELPTSGARTAQANGAAVHVIERGDTLSAIAAEDLGDPYRYPEIFDLNVDDTQPDGRRLEDPNLILPGWELELPTGASIEPTPAHPEAPTDATEPSPPVTNTEPIAPPSAPPATPTPTTAVTPPSTTGTQAPLEPRAEDGDASTSDWSTAASTLAGVTGALAAGLAVRIGLLRRRRSVRGARVQTSLTEALAKTEAAVTAASDVPLIRWAGQHLAQLTTQLDRRRVSAGPVALEISESSGIEVLWETPQPDAPQPWRAADGGWAWRLTYDPEAAVPTADLPSAIPALVTIGEREGRQLLLDLEAYGAVTVGGPADRVEAFLRSVVLELASSDDLADADALAVGLDPGIDHLDRLSVASVDEAVSTIERATESVGAAVDAAGVHGTFAARVGSSIPIEATVVVAGTLDAVDTDRLVARCTARRGVAVIAAGLAGTAPAHLEIGTDGCGRLSPLDLKFSVAGVTAETAGAVDDLLAALEDEPTLAPDIVDVRDAGPFVTSSPSRNGHDHVTSDVVDTNGHRPGDAPLEPELFPVSRTEPDEPRLLVRVLGTPFVPDRPELGRRELILTVYLACREGPVAASAAQDALWGGKPVEAKTVWNVIGATRRALGDLDDGTALLPAADRTRGGTLQLAPGVTTDLAQLRGIVGQAGTVSSSEAIGLLREALALVTGPPFDAVGYDWAFRDQDVAEAATLIEHAVQQLVELALDAGLVDVAREAIMRGLRGLPGNEELYRCRMRVEHHAGNLAAVTAAYEELVTYLTDLETEPSPATDGLFRELVRPVGRR